MLIYIKYFYFLNIALSQIHNQLLEMVFFQNPMKSTQDSSLCNYTYLFKHRTWHEYLFNEVWWNQTFLAMNLEQTNKTYKYKAIHT